MVRYRPAVGSTRIARRLRGKPTDAEKRMRDILRACFPEARFRRQVPIRGFFADFCSHRFRPVVEVDGGQHDEEVDHDRTAAIEAEGYRVLRFWNHDVLGNADGVAAALAEALHQRHPHPTLPHQGGGLDARPAMASLAIWGCPSAGIVEAPSAEIADPARHRSATAAIAFPSGRH